MNITTKILFIILLIMLYPSQSPAQWVLKNNSYHHTVESFTAQGTEIFTGLSGDGIIRSTNGGETWDQVNTGLPNLDVRAVLSVPIGNTGSYLTAGTWGNGVFSSTDNGSHWNDMSIGWYDSELFVSSLTTGILNGEGYSSAVILAGTWSGKLFFSSDNELTWWTTALIFGSDWHIRSLLIDDSCVFVGEVNRLVKVWVQSHGSGCVLVKGLTNTTITALVRDGGDLFAGTAGSGIFRSANKGVDWVAVNTGLENLDIAALMVGQVSGYTIIFAATWGGGVFYSANNGEQWIAANEGMTGNLVRSLFVFNDFLFAGNDDGTIWRRPLSDFATTNVRSTDNQIAPKDYSLSQNYPNPFNPTTTIGFQIPRSEQVKLIVYDLFGKEVKTLINKEMKSGSHQCVFDGSGLASGVYLYRLQANGFVQSKKFVLLK